MLKSFVAVSAAALKVIKPLGNQQFLQPASLSRDGFGNAERDIRGCKWKSWYPLRGLQKKRTETKGGSEGAEGTRSPATLLLASG